MSLSSKKKEKVLDVNAEGNVGEKKNVAKIQSDTEKAADQTEFSSNYSPQIKETMQQILNREPFEYNVNVDKLYNQYKDTYTAAGKQAMQDTVGNAALMTGGYGNSYGVTAGQQVYNGYMQQLNEIVPQLEERAYQRWLNEGDMLYDRLEELRAFENTDYERYRDTVADSYRRSRDAVQDYYNKRDYERNVLENDREYELKKLQNALEDYYNRRDYDRKVLESDREYEFMQAQNELENYYNQRDYDRKVFESDRNFEYQQSQDLFKNKLQLKTAADSNKASGDKNESKNNDSDKFSPAEAYDFINDNYNIIYGDEEFAEALYQMFGNKKGFYEWLALMEVPGDPEERTYLQILSKIHPSIPSYIGNIGKPNNKWGLIDSEQAYKASTGGGATPPHGLLYYYR